MKLDTILKAVACAPRLAILAEVRNGRRTVTDIQTTLSLTQPSASTHLKILTRAGLVECDRQGRFSYYTATAMGGRIARDIDLWEARLA